jgi:hypothetical protein
MQSKSAQSENMFSLESMRDAVLPVARREATSQSAILSSNSGFNAASPFNPETGFHLASQHSITNATFTRKAYARHAHGSRMNLSRQPTHVEQPFSACPVKRR